MARTRRWQAHIRLGRRLSVSQPLAIRWLSRVFPLVVLAGLLWSGWGYARDGISGAANGAALSRGQLAMAMDAALHDAQIESTVGGGERACFERLRARGLIERYPDGEFHPERSVHRVELGMAWGKLVKTMQWHRGMVRENPVDRCASLASGTTAKGFATLADLGILRSSTKAVFEGLPFQETPKMLLKQLVQIESSPAESGEAQVRELSSEKVHPRAPTLQSLEGLVLDALTGKPIADAALSIAGTAARTNANGRFPITSGPSGDLVEFLVTADGYRSLTVKRRVESEKPEGVVFRLSPQRVALEGRVLSKTDGKPLSGISVTIGERRFKTDVSGYFRVQGLKPGYVTLELSGAGFHQARELLFIEEKSSTRTLRLDPNLG